MATFTAQELIAIAKACIAEDAARMSRRPAGIPPAAWRIENPIPTTGSFQVRDLACETKPERTFWFDVSGNPYDLWVWDDMRLVARIDLRSADADQQLARFERI